ncbi:MAG TPA: S41 family peptidase [Candidatus Acidoferrales bacterium]|nr:S41 family peptidase [Candidatus Acidoferrales bacterium]
MSPLTKKIVVVLSVVVFVYVTAGYVLGRSSDDKAFNALTDYSEVLEHIQRDYVDDPNIHKVTSGALHGLLDSLDPQSGYMSPLEYTDYKEKSANAPQGSAGLTLTKRFGYIGVISSLPGSPGDKANLHLGDVLEKIAGFTTGQMSIDQAQVLLTGDPGSVVKLSVIRRDKTEPQNVDLTLAKLTPPKPVEDKVEGDIAYLRVPEFESGVTKQISDALGQFERQGVHRLILDLRDCSAGDDREGISTAQLFLSSGSITTLKGQTVSPVVSSANPSKVVWKQPVTVLIGNSTAGPAEIIASAIADNHRGETVGDRTYGTASMQRLIQLDDGSALILTVATYYTPNGKEIPVDGVAPTTIVQPSPDDVADSDLTFSAPSSSLSDPVVKKAVEILQDGGVQRKAA